MLVALVPIAAAASLAALPFVMVKPPPPDTVKVAVTQAGTPVQGRAVQLLEPRSAAPTPRLRDISLRGRGVAFGEGVLEGAPSENEPSKPFVLKHTDVRATVTGFATAVTVTQEFENPFDRPVEAVYVFPLPDDAAVDEMTLTAGTRVIRAAIQKRERARQMYEEAKAQGRRAALLDQERPNIFTQSVANLLPGERVKVSLRYVAALKYDDGQYTFNFPMTVGPRFVPGAPLPGVSQGTGTSPDTDRVLDASRITPPVERSGRDISVSVHLVAGARIEELSSRSHRMQVTRDGDGVADVSLDAADQVPNRDFILKWRVTGEAVRAAVLSSGGSGGTFALMVMPQRRDVQAKPTPKEMVFVIDTSCSMAGPPLDAAKRAMRSAMQQMNPDDTFMLIDFADRASSFHDRPLPNLPQHVDRALKYLDRLPAAGGTNQLDGLLRALRLPTDRRHLREVILMTDGFIGNETEILAAAEANLGEARVFGFGVGNSVNHYLLSRLSQVGRGFYQYVRTDEDPEGAVERFVRRIERPMLTDLSVTFSGVEVFDVLPRKVPDLFDAQPVVLIGRYKEPGSGLAVLHGMSNGRPEEVRVTFELPKTPGSAPGLSSLWARARIEELDMMQHSGEQAEIAKAIQTLGLEYHLVTKYTSFVAVDDVRVTDVASTTVEVPNEPVDGTKHLAQKRFSVLPVVPNPGPRPEKAAEVMKMPPPPPPAHGSYRDGDDEFARAFGGEEHDGRDHRSDNTLDGKKYFYVPPAPGSAGSYQETLGQADVMEVVKGNLGAIKVCVDEQKRREPGVGGKIVFKWTIGTNGKVLKVEIVSLEFKDTYLAGCMTALAKTWQFPIHKTQGEPVVFPFKF